VVAAATKSRYRLAELQELLAEPPKWVSTRPVRPAPTSRTPPVIDRAVPASAPKAVKTDTNVPTAADEASGKPTKK
jgi:hypothetical protein